MAKPSRPSRRRKASLNLSEAAMYGLMRGFLGLEVHGRTSHEVRRLKLLGDQEIYQQPGQKWERLGARVRRLLSQMLADAVVSRDGLNTLFDREIEDIHSRGLGGISMLIDLDAFDEGFIRDVFDIDSADEEQAEDAGLAGFGEGAGPNSGSAEGGSLLGDVVSGLAAGAVKVGADLVLGE